MNKKPFSDAKDIQALMEEIYLNGVKKTGRVPDIIITTKHNYEKLIAELDYFSQSKIMERSYRTNLVWRNVKVFCVEDVMCVF